ncbi:MAG: hypothetical protein QXO55_06195 [Candidatus Korarchaeum sp.]
MEKYIKEEEALKVEAALVLVSIYDFLYNIVSELNKLKELVASFSLLIIDRFSEDFHRIENELGSIAVVLATRRIYDWEVMENFAFSGEKEFYREKLSSVLSDVQRMKRVILDNVSLACEVLADVVELSDESSHILKFLSARIRELPAKVWYLPTNFLDSLLSSVVYLLPRNRSNLSDVLNELSQIEKRISRIESEEGEKFKRAITFLKNLLLRYPRFSDGVHLYLEGMRAELRL